MTGIMQATTDPSDVGIDLYRRLLLARGVEEAVLKESRTGSVPGFVHSGIGQEAVGVGVASALRADDYLLQTHRGFAHVVAKGMAPGAVIAEHMGRSGGCCGGRGGFHFADPSVGVPGIGATLGSVFPIALGLGESIRRQNLDRVVVAFYGDGAASRGTAHEAMIMAANWQLPILWVAENNLYAISLRVEQSHPTANLADAAAAYGMPAEIVDGQDVEAVYEATQQAVADLRAGAGPRLIEAKTYRFRNHHEGDPGRYRSAEEVEAWRQRDPLELMRIRLTNVLGVTEEELSDLQAEVASELADAVRFARESPLPDPATVLEGLYA